MCHWFSIAIFVIYCAFFAIRFFALKKRNFDKVALIVWGIYGVGAILTTIFADCTLCTVFLILNWVVFVGTGILLFVYQENPVLSYVASIFDDDAKDEDAKPKAKKEKKPEENKVEEKKAEKVAEPVAVADANEDARDDADDDDDADDNDADDNEADENAVVADNDDTATVYDEETKTFVTIRYSKSMSAKLSLADDDLRKWYCDIRNYALSHKIKGKKLTDRMTWRHECIRLGRTTLVRIQFRGRKLCVYLPLDANSYVGTKYRLKDVSDRSAYAQTPSLFKVSSPRKAKYAIDLIADVMKKYNLEKIDRAYEDFLSSFPKADRDALIEQGLIKVIK